MSIALSEDQVKKFLQQWLNGKGWRTQVAWGKSTGIDVDSRKDGERWIIEAKGSGSRTQMQLNYFLAALGELLQQMNDPAAKYSIALPDIQRFRTLWNNLPVLARSRTGITALFVDGNGNILEVQ